jgi:hypothetical protein
MISSVPMRNFMTLFVLMEEHNVGKAGKKRTSFLILVFQMTQNFTEIILPKTITAFLLSLNI